MLITALGLNLAGCGGGGSAVAADETNDGLYQQAQDLKKQGRTGEALSAFLKVIDRRGESGAPESHLEAGALYLNWAKDPVEAYHHFSKYLALQPTGPRSDMVRGQRDAAKRELARVLLAPSPDQMMRMDRNDELDQLRRRVQELEAELRTLQGASSVPVVRGPPVIALGDDSGLGRATEPPADASVPVEPRIAQAEAGGSPFTRNLGSPGAPAVAPATAAAPTQTVRPSTPTPTRPTAPAARPTPMPAGRRSHTVAQGEGLWSIARRYYGGGANGARVQAIYEANRDVMRSPSDIRPGMVLRIP